MKAYLLAAGLGTRLRPLTDNISKCLVPICGEPLLAIWFRLLYAHGIEAVLINVHHLAEQVAAFARAHAPQGLQVTVVHEAVLLGSAGTVLANRAFVANEREFFVLYADNLTNVDLSAIAAFHRARQANFTMGLWHAPEPRACGIAELDGDARIVSFIEKPAEPRSDLANAGIYIATQAVFDDIPAQPLPVDFGLHVLPRLVGRMHGVAINGYLLDIGNHERLARAEREWPHVAHPPLLPS
jgi:mannose-1-phosphate guanylyltransferase